MVSNRSQFWRMTENRRKNRTNGSSFQTGSPQTFSRRAVLRSLTLLCGTEFVRLITPWYLRAESTTVEPTGKGKTQAKFRVGRFHKIYDPSNHRSDNFFSVAYWYQLEPRGSFPPRPPVEERLPKFTQLEGLETLASKSP